MASIVIHVKRVDAGVSQTVESNIDSNSFV
jgi:hypothetical protein